MMKKGSIGDIGILLLAVIVLVVSGMFGKLIFNEIQSGFQNQTSDTNVEEILESGDTATDVFLQTIPFMLVGFGLAALILAFLIPTHPIFVPISIIALIIYEVIAVTFANFLWEVVNYSQFIPIANENAILVQLIRYLPHVIFVFGVALIAIQSRRIDQ